MRFSAALLGYVFPLLFTVALATVAQAEPLTWRTSIESGRAEAARTGKLLLVHFWSTHCGPCVQLDRKVYSQPQVAHSIARHFVPVKINTEVHPELARRHSIRFVPTDLVMDASGRILATQKCPPEPSRYLAGLMRLVPTGKANRQATSTPGTALRYENVVGSRYASNFVPGQPAAASPAAASPVSLEQSLAASPQVAVPSTPLASPSGPAPQVADSVAPLVSQGGLPQTGLPQSVGPRYGVPQPTAGGSSLPTRPQRPYGAPPSPVVKNTGPHVAASQVAVPEVVAPQVTANQAPAHQVAAHLPPQRVVPQSMAPSTVPQSAAPQNALRRDMVPQSSASQSGVSPLSAVPGKLGPGLGGMCPVELSEHQAWVAGDRRWGAHHRGRLYLFAGEVQQQRFLANPDYYSPVLSGYDPVVALREGRYVPGYRSHGAFYHGRVFLFASEANLAEFYRSPGEVAQAMVAQATR